MVKLVECVPNFSEGRRKEVIEEIAGTIRGIPGIYFLDAEYDKNHNRSVMTFVGPPEPVMQAAFAAIAKASELIDLTKHEGEHPRIGATDVMPFIPIEDVTMKECVTMAKEVGKAVAEYLHIPVYLYEEAATREDRKNLANIRKGEFEGLRADVETNPDRKPDFGEAKLHPTAGATVIGARYPLVAYNVYLDTKDIDIAKKIAKKVRFKDGGLPHVKALGMEIQERGLVQVSMNLTNYEVTPVHVAFEAVKAEAEKFGVRVHSSEIVGLVPMKAIAETAASYLKMESFTVGQVLEKKMAEVMKKGDGKK